MLVCAAASWPAARADEQPPTLAPFVTLTGAHSHVTVARCVRIPTHDAWAALWLEHLGEPPRARYDLYFNTAGLPLVDFERCMVIAVFDGATENSAGYEAVPVPAAADGADAEVDQRPIVADVMRPGPTSSRSSQP